VDPRRVLAFLAILAMSVALTACGGDDSEEASESLPETPTLTVPGDEETPGDIATGSDDEETTTETSTTTTEATPTQTAPAQADPAAPSGGAAAPQTGGATPDTEQNDQPPPADSPASEFEQFCQDNPGAC
jgi:hypothetical protein